MIQSIFHHQSADGDDAFYLYIKIWWFIWIFFWYKNRSSIDLMIDLCEYPEKKRQNPFYSFKFCIQTPFFLWHSVEKKQLDYIIGNKQNKNENIMFPFYSLNTTVFVLCINDMMKWTWIFNSFLKILILLHFFFLFINLTHLQRNKTKKKLSIIIHWYLCLRVSTCVNSVFLRKKNKTIFKRNFQLKYKKKQNENWHPYDPITCSIEKKSFPGAIIKTLKKRAG